MNGFPACKVQEKAHNRDNPNGDIVSKMKKGNCSNEREAHCSHWDCEIIGLWGGWYDGSDTASRKKDPNPLTHWWAE